MSTAEELECALTESQQLKQRVGQGERLKEQHEGLLGMLRQARAELDKALEGRQQAQAAIEPLQQRVRAMSAKAAVSRETEHKMAVRWAQQSAQTWSIHLEAVLAEMNSFCEGAASRNLPLFSPGSCASSLHIV